MGVVTYHYNPRIQRQEEDHKFQTSKYEASEMAQQLKAIVAFPKDMVLFPAPMFSFRGSKIP